MTLQLLDLDRWPAGEALEADVVIVGGGPAGLTVARELFGHAAQVLVLESGSQSDPTAAAGLNTVELAGEPVSPARAERRRQFHGASLEHWSHETQPYGVRCRVLGGSSYAWAGKSAAFDALDYAVRPWVPHSGWPVSQEELAPFVDRAASHLNLGPNVYDEALWTLVGRPPPEPPFDPSLVRPFFWQFARSRNDTMDTLRFGPEFAAASAPNVRVVLNATVTRVMTTATASTVVGVEAAARSGTRVEVRGRLVVLAASAIENARLLLASRQVVPSGLGNGHGVVGRYLIDHQGVRLGRFSSSGAAPINRRFGFHGVADQGRTLLYMHGLALPAELQAAEGLLNCAVYFLEERAADDPIESLKRLLQGRSKETLADLAAVAFSPGHVARGVALKALQSGRLPKRVQDLVIETTMRVAPNMAVRAHLDRGIPHKLTGMLVDGISEQRPDPDNRVTLSEARDSLGVPRPRVHWRRDPLARRSLARLAGLVAGELERTGLPAPELEGWVGDETQDDLAIDMAHTMGTTRMSDDPRQGVVDRQCRVHGVVGLYIAGGSVFPTGGHANPTLMIVALAVRLADHLKCVASQPQEAP